MNSTLKIAIFHIAGVLEALSHDLYKQIETGQNLNIHDPIHSAMVNIDYHLNILLGEIQSSLYWNIKNNKCCDFKKSDLESLKIALNQMLFWRKSTSKGEFAPTIIEEIYKLYFAVSSLLDIMAFFDLCKINESNSNPEKFDDNT